MSIIIDPKEKVQKAQKETLDNMKEAKDFDSIRQNIHKDDNVRHKKQKLVESCKYYGTWHPKRLLCLWENMQQIGQDQSL